MHTIATRHINIDAGIISSLVAFGVARTETNASDDLPATVQVTGVVRDFEGKDHPNGHPDMEKRPDRGFGRYSGNIAPYIGPAGKPIFTGNGAKVANQWRDSENRQISYLLYDPALGDTEGSFSQSSNGGITSAETFGQWYKDVPGINISAPLTLTLVQQDDGHYVFDDQLDPVYQERGGFYPIDDQLLGNTDDGDHNLHFTFELHMEFRYDGSGDQFFQFIGDDDVWVFVDGKLVVDLGGVHAAHDQFVDMNRLDLQDGEIYAIDFFYAERHSPQANFRLETNIPFSTAPLPTLTYIFD